MNERYEWSRSILKIDWIRYTPLTSNSVVNPNQQTDFDIATEDSVFSKDSYIELDFNAKLSIRDDSPGNTDVCFF